MFLFDAPFTLREHMTSSRVRLADIHRAVAELLSGRRDAVVFGAQAVNAYVDEERMTSDIDVMSTNAEELAEEIRAYLSRKFYISVRVRTMTKRGAGFRVYQVLKPKNRSLVDVRQESHLPGSVSRGGVQIAEPIELIVLKIKSYAARRNQIKGDTDRVDIRRMLLTFPKLRKLDGEITGKLLKDKVSDTVLEIWYGFVKERLEPD